MIDYSPSTMLAWEIAAVEARAGKATAIAPAHLLVGACKLCETDLERFFAASQRRSQEQGEIKADVESLREKFQQAQFDPSRFRRRLRGLVFGSGSGAGRLEKMHRSEVSRKAFEQAEYLAAAEGSKLQLAHLMPALLAVPEPLWTEILAEMGLENPLERIFGMDEALLKVNVDTGMAAIAFRELLERVSQSNLSPEEIGAIATEIIENNPLLEDPSMVERAIKGNRKLRQLLKAAETEVLKPIFARMGVDIAMLLERMAY